MSSESVIFNVQQFGIKISRINFRASQNTTKGINAKNIALRFVRSNGDKNLDASIDNCYFVDFRYAIYGQGANLKITDNTFTSCYVGISISNATLVTDDEVSAANTRGHIICRNRFHSLGSHLNDASLEGSTAIKLNAIDSFSAQEEADLLPNSPQVTNNQEYTIFGYYNHITNNYADDCRTFYFGTIDRTKIDGNSILLSGGTAISIVSGQNGSICNNLIDGSFRWNPNQLYYSGDSNNVPTGHGIEIEYANFLTINNNQVLNKRFHGIFIKHSKNTSIQSNTIKNFNRHRNLSSSLVGVLSIFDDRIYDGIHIQKNQSSNTPKYNIQNIVSNNVIGIPLQKCEGRYAIYMGDGDDYKWVKNNFIIPTRILESIKIIP